ncbi:Uncharacterised protein [Legionella wadsworthii]|uniref:Uncharacterized protein n=1 Tax=Legionella wadsworthii TaxID=28088 RepID=A0A378LTD0_9GAMM|nr:Uncharacterised protein [Legionella wadsworthii]
MCLNEDQKPIICLKNALFVSLIIIYEKNYANINSTLILTLSFWKITDGAVDSK